MKAWIVMPKNEFYCEVIFAETRGKARAKARYCDGFEDCEFVDIEVRRMPKADRLYKGQFGLDWYNADDRIFLVKDCGWDCGDDYFDSDECEECPAKEYCDKYKDYMNAWFESEGEK